MASTYSPSPREIPGGVPRLLIALVLSGMLVVPLAADKRHYAAHRLSGRIIGAVLIWLAFALLIWLILMAVAWLVRRIEPANTSGVPGGVAAWTFALALGAVLPLHRALTRHHYASPGLGAHIAAGVIDWLGLALAIRVVLLLDGAWRERFRGREQPRRG